MTEPGEADEELIGRYARGDVAAFDELYRRHEMRVWRYLERNVGNRATADELMQEVWFAVARDAVHYRPRGRFCGWLFAIARHRMLDAQRQRRTQRRLEAVGAGAGDAPREADAAPSPLNEALEGEQARALRQAISQLPHEQRDAFLLQVEGELSVEEVAAITQCSFETTKSRLRYARGKLRELMSVYV
ncbi:MAG TPA: sigma-70 family RNA polymerase sigma factor [Steroidobacteraceae bacterium]|nr:sigma-70 family RNA polymerase sigma factor [Steroidobacteraceae bacterium]